jgi:hypothetical protein
MFAASTLVPTAYQSVVIKGFGDRQTTEANPAALANCIVALDMAARMNANPLMVMQNLHIIEGRPSWSSQFIIAAINSSGKFSPLRFELVWLDEIDASYTTFEWVAGKKVANKQTVRIVNARCTAWALELATGQRLESAPVTMAMAVAENWYGKNGSKWQSMPDLMLRYRSAAFFGRIYAPELLMGLHSAEETGEIIDIQRQDDGSYSAEQMAPEQMAPLSKSAQAEPPPESAKAYSADTIMPNPDAREIPAAWAGIESSKSSDAASISASQVKYLNSKIAAIELPEAGVAAILQRMNVTAFDQLNVEQFNSLKSEFVSMGA